MFYVLRIRLRSFVILLLTVVFWLNVTTCYGEDTEEEVTAAPEEEYETEASAEQVTEEVTEASTEISVELFDWDECSNPELETRQKCCKFYPKADKHHLKCSLSFQKKIQQLSEQQDVPRLAKEVSCMIECIFKSKKYAGRGDSLNMKEIRADVAKKYKSNKLKQNYLIELFEYCERDASKKWNIMKKNWVAKVMFAGACKPFLMHVFICTAEYGENVKCPFYVWKGVHDNKELCQRLKRTCEK